MSRQLRRHRVLRAEALTDRMLLAADLEVSCLPASSEGAAAFESSQDRTHIDFAGLQAEGEASGQPVTQLTPGQYVVTPSLSHSIVMQSDGNLVLWSKDHGPLWSSATWNQTVTHAVMQSDGNFVLFNNADVVWHTETYGHPGATMRLSDSGELTITTSDGTHLWSATRDVVRLGRGQQIGSENGEYSLVLQQDGNLVLWSKTAALWSSNTFGQSATHATMQTDGNFVVYAGTTPLWQTATWGTPNAQLTLQTDGKLILKSENGDTLWSSAPEPGDVTNLELGESIDSENGLFELRLNENGRLVVNHKSSGDEIWSTYTNSSDEVVRLVAQSDGNLVLYSRTGVAWSSNTWGNAGARFRLENSGDIVIYSNSGEAIWSSRIEITRMNRGDSVYTSSGEYVLVFQSDSNIVLYSTATGQPLWSTQSSGSGATVAEMQSDGNFVLKAGTTLLGSTNTAGNSGARMLFDDGHLSVYGADGHTTLWDGLAEGFQTYGSGSAENIDALELWQGTFGFGGSVSLSNRATQIDRSDRFAEWALLIDLKQTIDSDAIYKAEITSVNGLVTRQVLPSIGTVTSGQQAVDVGVVRLPVLPRGPITVTVRHIAGIWSHTFENFTNVV